MKALLKKLQEVNLFDTEHFRQLNIDDALDMRDEPEFEEDWMRVSDAMEETECSAEDAAMVKEICKQAFLAVYRVTESGELAGYVSDDFELIAKAVLSGYEDAWLNALILTYADGKFPHETLEPAECSLTDAMQKLTK